MLNLLLITADQWRGDCLGAMGHPVIETPSLDALAEDAVLFTRHFGQATPCGPARASLLTGLYAFNHRSVSNGTPLDARHKTLAQIARRHGYEPKLFGYTDTSIDPRTVPSGDPRLCTYEGIAAGFDAACLLTETAEPWLDELARRGYGRLTIEEVYDTPFGSPARFSAADSETAFLADRVIDFLRQPDRQPWLVHLSFIKPHPPFIAAEPFHGHYPRHVMPPARRAATPIEEGALHPWLAAMLARPFNGSAAAMGSTDRLDDTTIAELRAIYLGLVSEVDHHVGRILRVLGETGALERTVVIVTADHGEMLGDHWQIGKSTFWPEAFHVPLIIRHPNRSCPGRRVTAFTEHVDLMPTALAALGLPVPRQCDGLDLSPWLFGETPATWRDAVLYEHDFRDLETGWHRTALGLDDERAGLAARLNDEHLYVHFSGLPALCLRRDDHGHWTSESDPAVALRAAQAMLDHRMAKTERRLTGCLLTPDGVIGGYDPI